MLFVVVVVWSLSVFCSAAELSIITKSDDGSVYKNEYFGMSVKKPGGWYYQPAELTKKMSEAGGRMLSGDDKNMQALFKESLNTTVALFTFFEHAPGTPVATNSSIVAVAENVKLFPGVKNGCDYLFHVRNILSHSAMDVDIEDGCASRKIDESIFGVLTVHSVINGISVNQKYYSCVQNEHAISIIQTYFGEDSKSKVDRALESVKLRCQ